MKDRFYVLPIDSNQRSIIYWGFLWHRKRTFVDWQPVLFAFALQGIRQTFSRQDWRTPRKRSIVVKYPGDAVAPGRCRTGSGEEVFGTTGSRTVVERNLPVTFTSVCWRWATKMSTAPAFKVNQGQLSGHSVLSSRLESQLPTRCPSRNLMFSIL